MPTSISWRAPEALPGPSLTSPRLSNPSLASPRELVGQRRDATGIEERRLTCIEESIRSLERRVTGLEDRIGPRAAGWPGQETGGTENLRLPGEERSQLPMLRVEGARRAEEGSEMIRWRHALDQWKTDLVGGLSYAAVELGGLQEDVCALQEHVASLQGSVGLSGRCLANAQDTHQRANASQSSITTRLCRVEAMVALEFPTLRGDLLELRTKQASWTEDTGNLKASQLRSALPDMVEQLKSTILVEISAKIESKVDASIWRETNLDVDANIRTVCDMTRAVQGELDTVRQGTRAVQGELDTWCKHADETLCSHYDDIRRLMACVQCSSDEKKSDRI